MTIFKRCSKCNKHKAITEFHSNGGGRHRGSCKECEANRSKARYVPKVTSKPLPKPRIGFPVVKFIIDPVSGCFNCTAAKSSNGRIPNYLYRNVAAVYADIEGKDVHHECRNSNCVNPAHLMVLTPEAHIELHKAEHWIKRSIVADKVNTYIEMNPDHNCAQVAKGLGIKQDAVSRIKREFNLKISATWTSKHHYKDQIALLMKTIKDNPTLNRKGLANITGLSYILVCNLIKQNDIEVSRRHSA